MIMIKIDLQTYNGESVSPFEVVNSLIRKKTKIRINLKH